MNNMNNKNNQKKIMKTQKERIDKGRQAFNDEIIRCSESDNIYEAILEWEFTWEIDYYSRDIDIDIMKEILVNEGRSYIVDKVKINEYGDGYGSCICGKHNLRRVYYIQNKINKTVLPTGSDCINKVFPDGSITKENILFMDKILNRSKRNVKEIRKLNEVLKYENMVLVQRNTDLIYENEKLKLKIDELILESKTNPDKKAIAEGHLDLVRKLEEATAISKDKETIKMRVNALEREVKIIKIALDIK